jgi:hypothetical protein
MCQLNQLAIIRPNYKNIIGEIYKYISGLKSQPSQGTNTYNVEGIKFLKCMKILYVKNMKSEDVLE